MAYRVVIEGQPRKALARLPEPYRTRINTFILSLEDDPRPHGSERLKTARPLLKYRIGVYRVVYEVRDADVVVIIVAVGHRSVDYRDL